MVPPPKFKDSKHFSKTSGKDSWYCSVCTPAERAQKESMTRADAVRHERTRAHTRLVEKLIEKEFWDTTPDYSGWNEALEGCTSWDHFSRADKMPDFIPFWRDGVTAAERGEEIGKMEDFLERLDHDIRKRVGLVDDQWGGDIGLNMWGDSPAPNAWGAQEQQKPLMRAKEWGRGKADWDAPDTGEGWGEVDGWPLWTVGDGWGVPADNDPWAAADETGWGARATDWGVSTATESSRKDDTGTTERAQGDVVDRELWTFAETVAKQDQMSPARKERLRRFFKLPTEEKIRQIQEAARILHTQS